MRPATLLRRLRASRSGVAMTEFALALPLLLGAGLFGAETAWLTLAHMKVSQTALQLADNASRIGDTSNLASRKIYESDIADILFGAGVLAESLDLYPNGRVVVSSMEVFDTDAHCDVAGTSCASATADDGDQFIHWQRCMGARNVPPRYGEQGDIIPDGMGPDGEEVNAAAGLPVIFVEVTYEYQPLFGDMFFGNQIIFETASFVVRDDRDLTQIYQRSTTDPDQVWSCNRFETDPLA